MSLQAIKAVLNKARVNPRLAQVDIPGTELFEALSRASQIFLQLLADLPTTGGNLRLVDCTVRDWDTVDRNYFLHMNREDQLEVLGVLTAIQHEWTHHLDLLSTPFGVNVHTKEVTEFLIFQELAPWLLEVPGERLASPLVDTLTESTFPGWARTHPSADLHSPEALLQGLAGKVFFDDYMTGAPQRHVEDGWYGGKDVIAIAGKKVECVTVNRVWPTLQRLSDNRNLGPYELLEGRALTMCLRRLAHLLGEDAQAFLGEYVRVFYHNQPRYRLLLEVIAGADLEEVLSTWPLRRVTSLLTEAQVFTWYALYAGPPLGESTVLASFPTVRLLAALQLFDTHGTEGCASWNDFLDLVDKSALASKNNFGTADDVRLQSLKMIATIVSQMEKVASPVMATHFNRVLCCQYELISKRFGSGYASLYGNPEHGNPLEGIDDEVARAILWVKQPDPLVRAWSNARNQLLYKYSLTATDRTNLLRQWFDPSSS